MLIENIKEEDLWKFVYASGSITAMGEIVRRHNKKREKSKTSFLKEMEF